MINCGIRHIVTTTDNHNMWLSNIDNISWKISSQQTKKKSCTATSCLFSKFIRERHCFLWDIACKLIKSWQVTYCIGWLYCIAILEQDIQIRYTWIISPEDTGYLPEDLLQLTWIVCASETCLSKLDQMMMMK